MSFPRTAIILAGGFGTRLGTLTQETPKPLLPLQGKPIMQYTIDLCRSYGVTHFLISVHFQKEKIKEYYGSGEQFGIHIEYLEEETPLGTGGCIRLANDKLKGTFIVANADELKDIDLEKMYEVHKRTNALATDALFSAEDPSMYGTVELRGEKILRFVEKPAPGTQPSNWCNAGLYFLEPQVLSYIPSGFCMLEKDVFPKLAMEGRMSGYCFSGQWFDTGTPERLATAQKHWSPPKHHFREELK